MREPVADSLPIVSKQAPEWENPIVKREMDELLGLRAGVMGLLEEARNDK